jgi:hypothetical protein
MAQDPNLTLATDREILDMVRQVNLDAFWSRESSTVTSNLRELVRMEKTTKRLGLPCVMPPLGPWPLEDNLGMKSVMAVLDRLLDKRVYEDTVQWDTFCCSMSVVTNVSQAVVGGLEDSVGTYESNWMFISDVITHKFWFSSFMTGIHKRVGQVRKPDKELMINATHAINKILEGE